jgi:hypothetical protein
MGLLRWGGAVLVGAAVLGASTAGGYSVSRKVHGAGAYAGGTYCRTTPGPLSGRVSPDEVTVWVMRDGHPLAAGPYHMSNPVERANAVSTMNGDKVDHVQACWN